MTSLLEDPRHGPLPALLLILTVLTGLVDAVSFLRLDRVFVANMTGNVVFLGFAAAGSRDVSALGSLLALAAFLAGAAAGGALANRHRHRGLLLARTAAIKTVILAAATLVALMAPFGDPVRYVLTGLLGVAMGLQNAMVRRLAVPDLTTTVLTMTMTGLAADSRFAGGAGPDPGRRLLTVLAMCVGAFAGGILVLRANIAASLGAATGLLVVTALLARQTAKSDATWTKLT